MRAKTAVKLRARVTAFKCDLCGRKLMTMDALIIHQRTAHNVITRRNKPKQVNKPLKSIKPQIKEKLTRKEPTPPKSTQKVKFSEPEKEESKKLVKENPPVNKDNASLKKKTVEFKCPKCFSVFTTYFLTHKHIQKYHCVNKQGAKVPPNSPSLIQPIRIELCNVCNRKVKSIQTHLCDKEFKELSPHRVVICMGCEDWLPNMKSFHCHILNSHAEDVESLFFPLATDFTSWKTDLENQTGVKYTVQEKYDSKHYYHCDYTKENNEKVDATHFCPSTIVVAEFSKGIQVHFFKKHFKHITEDYFLKDKYKKFTITSLLKQTDDSNTKKSLSTDENQLYQQFKSLMEGIIVDAANMNVATLKILFDKALKMTSVLTSNYDKETEKIDNQLTLEHSKMSSGKWKNDVEISLDVKETKDSSEIPEMSPKIVNSFSLATNEKNNDIDSKMEVVTDKENNEEHLDNEEGNTNKKGSGWDPYSSSFNDSYKDFVVKNFPIAEKDIKKKIKKPVVKTKIGQFKPSLSPKSPKTPEESKVKEKVIHRLTFDKPIVDLKYEVKEQEGGCNILVLKV